MTHEHTPDVGFAAHADHLEHGAGLWSEVTARVAAGPSADNRLRAAG